MRGPYSTPITPLTGSLFHADPQPGRGGYGQHLFGKRRRSGTAPTGATYCGDPAAGDSPDAGLWWNTGIRVLGPRPLRPPMEPAAGVLGPNLRNVDSRPRRRRS